MNSFKEVNKFQQVWGLKCAGQRMEAPPRRFELSRQTCAQCLQPVLLPWASTSPQLVTGLQRLWREQDKREGRPSFGPLLRCNRCKDAVFCSVACAEQNFQAHQYLCYDASADKDEARAADHYRSLPEDDDAQAEKEMKIFEQIWGKDYKMVEAGSFPFLFPLGRGTYVDAGGRFRSYRFHHMHFFDQRFRKHAAYSSWVAVTEARIERAVRDEFLGKTSKPPPGFDPRNMDKFLVEQRAFVVKGLEQLVHDDETLELVPYKTGQPALQTGPAAPVGAASAAVETKPTDGSSNISKHCEAESCGKPAGSMCSRCKRTYYCCKECQRAHWRQHKLQCNPT